MPKLACRYGVCQQILFSSLKRITSIFDVGPFSICAWTKNKILFRPLLCLTHSMKRSLSGLLLLLKPVFPVFGERISGTKCSVKVTKKYVSRRKFLFFKVVEFRISVILISFSLTWDCIRVKHSKGYPCHSFHLILTKLHDTHSGDMEILAVIILGDLTIIKILLHFDFCSHDGTTYGVGHFKMLFLYSFHLISVKLHAKYAGNRETLFVTFLDDLPNVKQFMTR